MKVIAELVEFFSDNGLLTGEDIEVLREQGILPTQWWGECDDSSWYDYENWLEWRRDRDMHSASDHPVELWDGFQEGMERAAASACKTGWVGKSRMLWWKEYQVSKLAGARRRR